MKLSAALTTLLSLALLLSLNVGCSAGEGPGPETGQERQITDEAETTAREAEEIGEAEETGKAGVVGIKVEQIAEGQRGPAGRGVLVAGSARDLARATGVEVPGSGGGLYVSAQAGERPTGGYRVSISGTDEGEIQIKLREPGEGDIVTQSLTQSYAVAVVKSAGDRTPEAGELRFVDASGEPLGWPVRLLDEAGG